MSKYVKQASALEHFNTSKNTATEASYHIALQNMETYSLMANSLRKLFLVAVFEISPHKETISISAKSVQRYITEMSEKVQDQQIVGIQNSAVFFIALDESLDVNDIPHLAVMARYSDSDVKEELCCLKPMTDSTKGQDITRAVIEHFDERGIIMDKMFAVTTDGAPAMVSKSKRTFQIDQRKC